MANEVAKVKNAALAGVAALKGNLQKVKQSLPEVRGSQYMRFLQDGSWVFGAENEEVLPEDKVAMNPLSIKTGFSCWTDRPDKGEKNEIMGEIMVPLGGDVPLKHELPEKVDPKNGDKVCEWREQTSVQLRFLSGPHQGKQVEYSTTSVGGIGAMSNIIDQLMLQLDEDPENLVPILSLDSDHYTHKKWGKTYVPVIRISDWTSMEEGQTAEDDQDDSGQDDGGQDDGGQDDGGQDDGGQVDGGQDDGGQVDGDQDAKGVEEAPTRRRRRR